MTVSFSGSVSPATYTKQTEKNQDAKTNYAQIATGETKPKFLKSYGNGFLHKLALNVPILGSYLIGKNMIEQDNEQNAIAQGKKNDNEDPGIFKSVVKGIGMKLSLFVPFYGTYRVGKEIIEQKNIQESLQTGNKDKATEKPKFWNAWWEGVKMELSQIVPVYGTYKLGKNLAVHKTLDKTI